MVELIDQQAVRAGGHIVRCMEKAMLDGKVLALAVPVRLSFGGLDAETEIYILLVAGVSVKIIRCAAVEVIALAKFPADEQAQGDRAEARGNPANGLNQRGFDFGRGGRVIHKKSAGLACVADQTGL